MASKNLVNRNESRERNMESSRSSSRSGSLMQPGFSERLFDRFWNDLLPASFGRGSSSMLPIDMCEDDKSLYVTAELPGMDDKDIDISLSKNHLIIQGEKKEDTEEEGKDFYRHERVFGSVFREIDLPTDIDVDNAQAEFKKGILTLTLPKSDTTQGMKKISVSRRD